MNKINVPIRDMFYVAFDTETDLIGAGNVIPNMICLTTSDGNNKDIYHVNDPETRNVLNDLLTSDNVTIIGHNVAFDLNVIMRAFPDLTSKIFDCILADRVKCTKIQEMFLNLADTGDIAFRDVNGKKYPVQYSLAALVKDYLHVDISAGKTDEDAWRYNYVELLDLPCKEWPEEATSYAIADADYTRMLHDQQNIRRQELNAELRLRGSDVFDPLTHRIFVDCALFRLTAYGNATNAEKILQLETLVKEEMHPSKFEYLYSKEAWNIFKVATIKEVNEYGDIEDTQEYVLSHNELEEMEPIGREYVPPVPYKNGAKEHTLECKYHPDNPNYVNKTGKDCNCPVKCKPEEPAGLNRKYLTKFVECLCLCFPERFTLKRNDVTDKQKEKGQTVGNISTDAEWMEEHGDRNPVLLDLTKWNEYSKLLSSYLPRMFLDDKITPSPVIHAPFDC
jgi:hypothetical protein